MLIHCSNQFILVSKESSIDIPENIYFLPNNIWQKIRFSNIDIILTLSEMYKHFNNLEAIWTPKTR